MKLKIENSGSEQFPFYQLIDENGNEICATDNLKIAQQVVKLFALPVVTVSLPTKDEESLSNNGALYHEKYVLDEIKKDKIYSTQLGRKSEAAFCQCNTNNIDCTVGGVEYCSDCNLPKRQDLSSKNI